MLLRYGNDFTYVVYFFARSSEPSRSRQEKPPKLLLGERFVFKLDLVKAAFTCKRTSTRYGMKSGVM